MGDIIEITSNDDFESEVLQASTPVLVDFGATWCGPCKMLDPVVAEMAQEWGDSVKVVKLDVDHSPDVAMNYQVMGVPTLILFKDGKATERMTGYLPKPKILKKLSPHL